MKVRTISLALFMAVPQLAAAQQMSLPQLDPVATEGRAIFSRSCSICHLPPQYGAATFGPPLHQASLGGDPAIFRQVISEGMPHMPAFKHMYNSAQIDAIIAYLKTVPPVAAAPSAANPAR